MDQKELMQWVKDYWKQHDVFQKSLDQRSDTFQIATYDGPPFASGTPHFGHGLVGAMKDSLLRYKTMKWYKVNRDRWWDCHGLPVEKAVEKALWLDGKKDIEEKLWVEKFTEACRAYVGKTDQERRIFVDSIGRWADMDHAYYTMDLDYMESIIRVFQNMYNQNLVYKWFKVQRCCPSCATSLSNSEVNEWYKDRQDTAITIKFKIQNAEITKKGEFEKTDDGFIHTAKAIIRDEKWRYLTFFDPRWDFWTLPGGKVDAGENLEQGLKRELEEELSVQVNSMKLIWSRKYLGKTNVVAHYFDVTIIWEPTLQEKEKHNQLAYVEIIENDNKLGFAIKVNDIIIDDDNELISRFLSFYTIHTVLPQTATYEEMKTADVNILAWTTTPRTLPSNMFLAVGKHIRYYMVFDKWSKEYYILAENLVKQYYKNPDEYILINIMQWEDLVWISYEALFPFIKQSSIEQKYKDQFFRVIAADFVSTEDGTGIVHIAPWFGMDDFDAVAQFLPREYSKDWLFMPVNEYGEFTDEVADRKGQSVFDVNKEVITRLKNEKKLIGQKSYSHSYPHCRRCETPLISRALTSRFIKEPELTSITVPNAEKIWFVPESVKNRFIDVLKSAPDRNLSRNRYRGSPLPIWENQDNLEDKIVIGKLDELYERSRTWSKNITKHMVIRHGETFYNPYRLHDSYGNLSLDDEWLKQVEILAQDLTKLHTDEVIVVLSPLTRTWETAYPYLQTFLKKTELDSIKQQYLELQIQYQHLRDKKEIQAHVQNPKANNLHKLHKKVYMDFRITDILAPEMQNEKWPPHLSTTMPTSQKLTELWESMDDIFARCAAYVHEISALLPTKTILTLSHEDSVISIIKAIRPFDYFQHKKDYAPKNTQVQVHYRDNERKTEVDLHKPYVDNYWFMKDGHTYKRVPEVMDCWFESGSMPFGQAHYLWEKNSKFVYPAEFIIEWLDQTRGRFRWLHVCGNAVMKWNSFNNVVINGLILAEDGRKMSKSLRNYPDPEELFGKYGTDAYRLYMLSSPAVRAEPMRFSEKWVEQVYKDFTAAMINSYKFFETYAKVDNFVYNDPTVYYIRHGHAEWQQAEAKLLPETLEAMKDPKYIEMVLRTNPDVIYTSPFVRTKKTAEIIQQIFRTHRQKDIPIVLEEWFASDSGKEVVSYTKLIAKESGKNILIVWHDPVFQILRSHMYDSTNITSIGKMQCVEMPTHVISNELDKRILAAIHEVWLELETQMDGYSLDGGAKVVLSFVDKLNNWFIRRSRRRFRANGMDNDKASAYTTLFTVLERYMKICAPFAPFIAEHIYLELQNFRALKSEGTISVHLEHLPISSEQYVNRELLNEIAQVRRIISLGLFIRSKNKIAVKQPLSKMEIKM